MVLCPSDKVQEKFNQFKVFFNQPGVKLRSTNNTEFLEGKTYSSYDAVVLLAEDDVAADEYEMMGEFLEYYLAAPISGFFTTYPVTLDQGQVSKFAASKIVQESMTGREAEAVGMLAELVQTLKKHQDEHDASKVKTAFNEFDKDGSGAIDRSEL
jgi:hypothetical protein